MKRRKTVSVTPAMGASTVAGRISTPPSVTDAGTRASAGAMRSAGLSKNLCTMMIVAKTIEPTDLHGCTRINRKRKPNQSVFIRANPRLEILALPMTSTKQKPPAAAEAFKNAA